MCGYCLQQYPFLFGTKTATKRGFVSFKIFLPMFDHNFQLLTAGYGS